MSSNKASSNDSLNIVREKGETLRLRDQPKQRELNHVFGRETLIIFLCAWIFLNPLRSAFLNPLIPPPNIPISISSNLLNLFPGCTVLSVTLITYSCFTPFPINISSIYLNFSLFFSFSAVVLVGQEMLFYYSGKLIFTMSSSSYFSFSMFFLAASSILFLNLSSSSRYFFSIFFLIY